MNERFKDLFVKAGGRFSFDTNSSPYQFEYDELVKFAESIVKECSSICYKSNLNDSDAHAQNLLYEFNIDNARNLK